MGNPFQKVQPGERLAIPAEAFNTFVDAAIDFKNRQRAIQSQAEPRWPTSTILRIENASGEDRARFDLLGVAAPIIRPDENLGAFQAEPALCGATPRTQCHVGRFAILLEPVSSGRIGRCVVAGVTVARVDVSDESHRTAEIADRRSDALISRAGDGSATILWKEPGTGVRWAIVRLGDAADAGWTTTTADPAATTGSRACQGSCRWVWSETDKTWTLTQQSCAPATTTTTSPTTTTTPEPCPCGCCSDSTTTTGNPNTTTSTTTTPAPCGCLPPTFCGEADGECTVTYCIDAALEHLAPRCGQTTTTPEPTTTTTGDPSTTTTTCPPTTTTPDPCAVGCDWKWAYTPSGWRWVQIRSGCSSSCPCVAPESPGTFACAEASTPCVPQTATTPVPAGCTGYCDWYWALGGTAWALVYQNCSTQRAEPCVCPPPSTPGHACGDWARTGCLAGTTTSTTTPAPNPCDPTTTTGLPTSTTTTTLGPCNGTCKWQWSVAGSAWGLLRNDCAAECPCQTPHYDGSADCETAITYCRPNPPTTTTTQEPTTTTSTTTTTSCAWDDACAGDAGEFGGEGYDCTYAFRCCCDGEGGVGWYGVSYRCHDGGVYPAWPPPSLCQDADDIGATWYATCPGECPPVTTTSSTTTTTTTPSPTTTTTCSPDPTCFEHGQISCHCEWECCCVAGSYAWTKIYGCKAGTCGTPTGYCRGPQDAGNTESTECIGCTSTTTTSSPTTTTTGNPTTTTTSQGSTSTSNAP